jgi:transporter family-2 protein
MSSGYVVAGLVGVGIAVQVAIVGRASSSAHPLAISLALQVAGVAVAGVWATLNGAWSDVAGVARLWWWIPLGVGGWIVVAALGFAASRVGVATVLALSIGAQLIAGLAIDAAVGTNLVGTRSVLGVALVLSGVIVMTTAN